MGLREHPNAGVAACACGVHASLVTPKRLPVAAAPLDAVRYEVAIPNPSSGYVEVTAHFPTDGKKTLELAMPRWTPGSYRIRDFEKGIDDNLTAASERGEPLVIAKPDISRWTIDTAGATTVTVRYRVYSHSELSVRTNWVEPDFALLNGAATFMTIAGEAFERRHEVSVTAPSYSAGAVSAMPSERPNHFTAPSFDALVDSPIALGADNRREIVVDGVTYVLATHGADAVWDAGKAAAALERVVKEMHALWGRPPFDRYVFLNLLSEARGGLEHKDSTVLMHSRFSTRDRADFLTWIRLATHELFHAWNVKRLRPRELGPFDYMRENVTSGLWVAEGFTRYYDRLLCRRSGVFTLQEGLASISQLLASLQNVPGRQVQTLEQSSRDAWTNYYQPDENSPNATISYYDKGGVVALLLDAEIRKGTGGKKSLDDVMRLAYARYAGDTGYTSEQFEAVVSEVAGSDMRPWLDRALRSTDELPIADGIKALGLRFKDAKVADGAALGVETRVDGYRLVVTGVTPGGAGARAGVMPGDELIGIGGYRVPPAELEARLGRYAPGEASDLLVARRGKLATLPVTFAKRENKGFEVELDPDADADALARRMAWLGG